MDHGVGIVAISVYLCLYLSMYRCMFLSIYLSLVPLSFFLSSSSASSPFLSMCLSLSQDHRAYVHVGVAEAKVFIIDPSGVIHHINNSTYART